MCSHYHNETKLNKSENLPADQRSLTGGLFACSVTERRDSWRTEQQYILLQRNVRAHTTTVTYMNHKSSDGGNITADS